MSNSIEMATGEWRSVVGYEEHYRVSEHGRIYSYHSDRLLGLYDWHDRYYKAQLWNDRVGTWKMVHQVEAAALLGKGPPMPGTSGKGPGLSEKLA